MHVPSTTTFDDDQGEPAGTWADSLIDLLSTTSRHLALLTAWVALCGSLFFSEVLGWLPCLLCWYQRILMYPLAVILAIGIARRDRGLHLYVVPLSIAGAGLSLYHYLLIKTDWFPPPACAAGIPCNVDYLDWLGFINIPFLALTAFLMITCLMLISAVLEPPLEVDTASESLDEHDGVSQTPPLVDGPRLAMALIIVSVVLAFVVGSTFV